MRTVYKYHIDITDKQQIKIKKEAGTDWKIVHVGLDLQGDPCIWVELFPGEYEETCEIRIFGTGHPIYGTLKYVGSFIQGLFMWHVYQ